VVVTSEEGATPGARSLFKKGRSKEQRIITGNRCC
jgi:hypothetical protein